MQNNKKILLVAINAKYIHSNLAVYCLKNYSKDFDNYIEIAEYTINQFIPDILQDIYKRKPSVIAFSCYIWNIFYVNQLADELKKILPDCDIWVGGPEVSYRAREYLTEQNCVRGVMIGEGEKTFNKLVRYYVNNEFELDSINGISYKSDDNSIKSTTLEPLMDLSDVPFPYYDLSDFKNKIIYYESSRGCPFSCSYCLSSIDKQLRFRNIDKVKQELKYLIEQNIPQVKFVDRTFNCKKSHAMEIWNFIYNNDNGITNFHFEVSADLIDEEELELFSKMRPGLIQLEIGVQSTNSTTISEINRTMDLSRLKYVVNRINSFGNIHQHLDLIAGLPYEDYNTFISSFNDVYALQPEQLQLGFLKVLSGALMHERANEYGLVYTSVPPYEVLYTKWISFDEILLLKNVENMVEMYYNSRQFTNTLNVLITAFNTPFEMFSKLAEFYESKHLNEAKHSRIQRYNILLEFIKNNCEDVNYYCELLTLDLYLRENLKSRPDFAPLDNNSELHKHIKELYSDYKYAGKNIHIEPFSGQLTDYVTSFYKIKNSDLCIATGKDINNNNDIHYILFDYRARNPLNNEAKLIIVQ